MRRTQGERYCCQLKSRQHHLPQHTQPRARQHPQTHTNLNPSDTHTCKPMCTKTVIKSGAPSPHKTPTPPALGRILRRHAHFELVEGASQPTLPHTPPPARRHRHDAHAARPDVAHARHIHHSLAATPRPHPALLIAIGTSPTPNNVKLSRGAPRRRTISACVASRHHVLSPPPRCSRAAAISRALTLPLLTTPHSQYASWWRRCRRRG